MAALCAILCGVGPSSGCIEVEGGAVEVGWDLRIPQNGQRIGCKGDNENKGALRRLNLNKLFLGLSLVPIAGGADPCANDGRCRFECDTEVEQVLTGITPFFIPQGEYSIVTKGLGVDIHGQVKQLTAAELVAPPPVVRTVTTGEITDLNVNLIIIQR